MCREHDDGVVVLNAKTGACWELNRTGAALWSQLIGGSSLEDAVDALAAKHAVTREQVASDATELLERLKALGLVVEAGSGEHAG
jgi:hypothetical protein